MTQMLNPQASQDYVKCKHAKTCYDRDRGKSCPHGVTEHDNDRYYYGFAWPDLATYLDLKISNKLGCKNYVPETH